MYLKKRACSVNIHPLVLRMPAKRMTIGLCEIIAAFAVLIRPIRTMILALFIWKMGSELFYPHFELFEWIERGGSYGVLLALWFALDSKNPGKYTGQLI